MGKDSLGEFELLVLLACVRLGEDTAYAVAIVDEIRTRTGREIHRAAVYVTLQRLEEKGLIATRLGDALPERGGKARRLVKAGLAVLSLQARNILVSRLGDGGWWTLPAVIGVLMVSGIAATWVPLRRALRIRPQEALKAE